jgi:quaternary ammonium compound-resistance protein SugE
MAWIYLFIAGLFETAWAIGLKYSEGFTKLGPSLFTAAAMIISFYLLSLALRTLPVGTGYAVWTGIGTVGAAILGIVLFDESRAIPRILPDRCRHHRPEANLGGVALPCNRSGECFSHVAFSRQIVEKLCFAGCSKRLRGEAREER